MQSREKSVLTLIYPRRPSESLVLLGLKKRGFGEGKFNGFGGKLESGETLEESAVRELKEECGLVSKLADLKWRGCLTYIYNTKPKAMEVNVFDLQNWEGDPIETEEMKPRWFEHQAVPLSSMWADDEFWLLQYLEGGLQTPFIGRFRFKNHEGPESWDVLEHNIASLVPASVPRDIGGSESGAAMVASTVSFLNAPSARPLESFIRYHLSKGFARILIFIDSADDLAALDVVRRFPALRVLHKIRGPDLLKEQSVKSPDTFGAMSNFFNEVSARQLLDAELALRMAPELGCRWLLYLDSDELFYTKEASVVPHFQYLERSGIQQMSYLNHEGVPEKAETEDYFATVTLFKQHHFAVPLSAQARSALRFWMDRSKRGQYFLFYDNGKSACRTDCHAIPKNQHIWQLPPGSKSCTALADPRHMDVDGFVDCPDPCILHFPVCGLSWLTGKYRTLGRFPDKWLGKVNLSESFHKDARDLAESCSALEDLFMQEVLLEDKSEVGRQLEARTCMRILGHAELLDAEARASAVESESEKTILPLADASLIGIEKGWILSKAMKYL